MKVAEVCVGRPTTRVNVSTECLTVNKYRSD